MSDRTPPIDPFADDAAAKERERRRLERESKRRARSNRESLASRVSGILDGAATKGREAIEQTRERAKDPEPPAQGVEPPSFRRAPAAPDRSPASGDGGAPAPASSLDVAMPSEEDVFGSPARSKPSGGTDGSAASDEGRLSAESLMPRRPPRRRPSETEDPEAVAPAPVATRRGGRDDAGAGAAPPVSPPPGGGTTGAGRRPPRRPGAPSSGAMWRRRLMALAAVVAIVVAGAYAVSRVTNDDPAPAPKGPRTLATSSVTIPEGLTIEEMAEVAKQAGLSGDYEKEVEKAAERYDPERYGAPKDASLEGFLYPATYEVEKGAPVRDLIDKQLTAFDENFQGLNLDYAKKKNLTEYDVVNIAAMIEREVQVSKERPLVAAVIYNRLADGETLGIDATLRYEVGFDKPLTQSQLEMDTPYNTRIYPGLPPTPIGNPGLDSLEAAAKPADVDFKYYVFKPGTCGEHTFTADYDEFLALSDEYQAALEAEGEQPDAC